MEGIHDDWALASNSWHIVADVRIQLLPLHWQ